jgi:hypothetical protein
MAQATPRLVSEEEERTDVSAATPTPQLPSRQKRERARLQRAIVNTMLVEPDRKWTHAEMERGLDEHGPLDLSAALEHLAAMGVIVSSRQTFAPSQCTLYLDELRVIGI